MRRRVQRAKEAAELVMGREHLSLYVDSLLALLRAAKKREGVSVVPTREIPNLPLRVQAQFSVQHHVSDATMNALRQAFGGKHSGIASREDLRCEMTTVS